MLSEFEQKTATAASEQAYEKPTITTLSEEYLRQNYSDIFTASAVGFSDTWTNIVTP